VEKIERGMRNLEKFRAIASPKVWRGSVVFWNPTQDDIKRITVHGTDARLIVQFHDLLRKEQQGKLLLGIATLSGFIKLLNYAWSNASFSSEVTA